MIPMLPALDILAINDHLPSKGATYRHFNTSEGAHRFCLTPPPCLPSRFWLFDGGFPWSNPLHITELCLFHLSYPPVEDRTTSEDTAAVGSNKQLKIMAIRFTEGGPNQPPCTRVSSFGLT